MITSENADQLVIVLTTEVNEEAANKLAKELLTCRLAACISLRDVSSQFWWEERIETSNEVQLLIKTGKNQLKDLFEKLNVLHSYQTPEFIFWSASGSEGYEKWIKDSLL